MHLAPIRRSIEVGLAPSQAFDLFVNHMGDWWPKGKTPGHNHVSIIVEPREGGRWAEKDAKGVETQWGKVVAWEPPGRLVLGWQLNGDFLYEPDLLTEVELTFSPTNGGTLVHLEHRYLERVGGDGARLVEAISGGWTARLTDFAAAALPVKAHTA